MTNSNWEHFWLVYFFVLMPSTVGIPCRLNEGFTTYLERRIVAKLAGEQERHLHAIGETTHRTVVQLI